MAELVIGIGKPMGKGAKASDPMGDKPEDAEPESKKDPGDGCDAALDDAFEAAKSGDQGAFRDAMRAAMTACYAELGGEKEEA